MFGKSTFGGVILGGYTFGALIFKISFLFDFILNPLEFKLKSSFDYVKANNITPNRMESNFFIPII